MTDLSRQGERWQADEQRQLYDAYVNGISIDECTASHKRSRGGIRAMLRRLGLLDKNGNDILPRPEFKYYIRERLSQGNNGQSALEPAAVPPDQKDRLAELVRPEMTIEELLDLELIDLRVFNVLLDKGHLTVKEIAGINDNTFLRYANFGRHSLEQIRRIKAHAGQPHQNNDQEVPPKTLLPIETENVLGDIELVATTIDTIGRDDRIKRILKARLGVGPEQSVLTLQELGTEFGISRERVRQLEVKALRRVRGYIRKKYLPHSRYTELFDEKDDFANFSEQYKLAYETIGSSAHYMLAKLVYCFDFNQKYYRETVSQAQRAVGHYFGLLRQQVELEKSQALSAQQRFIADQILSHVRAAPLQHADDLAVWLKEARLVQDYEFSGTIFSNKANKDIQFESHAELRVLQALEKMREVTWLDVQCVQFEYKLKSKPFTYHPDIICRLDDGQVVVIEVKPAATMALLNTFRKAIIAQRYCDKNNWHYVILSPGEGAIDNMVKWAGSPEIEQEFVAAIGEQTIADYQGMSWPQMGSFMQKHKLGHRDLTAIALRNDLAFSINPYLCGRLPEGFSWSALIPALNSRESLNQERARATGKHASKMVSKIL